MKPQKIIASRGRSATARCDRWVYCDDEPRCYIRCGEPLVLFFTPSPLGGLPYETLVIQRCPEHPTDIVGVLSE